MKWFQHQSKAHADAKLQKVLMKYGFEGYGLYWYCIESICQNLEPRLTFELEQDSEILAHIGRMDSRVVEEIMLYMVNIGLFSETDGVVVCRTLARYLGDSLTRNEGLKTIIREEKSNHLSQTVSDSLRLSHGEERTGEERTGKRDRPVRKRTFPSDFVVDEKMVAWVIKKHPMLDWQKATDDWQTAMQAKGFKYLDWRKAWQNGMNKAEDWRQEKAAKCGTPTSHEDLMEAIADL